MHYNRYLHQLLVQAVPITDIVKNRLTGWQTKYGWIFKSLKSSSYRLRIFALFNNIAMLVYIVLELHFS